MTEKPISYRTRPCHMVKKNIDGTFRNSCFRRDCAFAHSWKELRPIMCSFDKKCKNRNCYYFHTGDNLKESLEDEYELPDETLPVVKITKQETDALSDLGYKYTKYCVRMGACKNKECTFAHTKEQLRILSCRNFENCRNSECTFLHAGEDEKEKREKIPIPVPKPAEKEMIEFELSWSDFFDSMALFQELQASGQECRITIGRKEPKTSPLEPITESFEKKSSQKAGDEDEDSGDDNDSEKESRVRL